MLLKGRDLIDLKYKPLFPFFAKQDPGAFKILSGDFVTTEDGTGIVHMAPGFGEDDYNLCIKNGIKVVCPVDDAGCFDNTIEDISYTIADKPEILTLAGRQVFETNDDIVKYLKSTGAWLKTEEYLHNYPHCWRTDTPIIYKAVKSWYVDVPKIKQSLCNHNREINWIPEHVRDGAFGNWIANAREWSVSRNRFFGCPIPVWYSDDPKYPNVEVYGSIEELEKAFGVKVTDLHRPFIDTLTRPNPKDPTGKSKMVRVEDVLDCWFESGSMPFASVHYPFAYRANGIQIRTAEENVEWFFNNYPADCISEYMAQTRGWFYTLAVLGVALFDGHPKLKNTDGRQPNPIPFKTVICHGTVLDINGQKLSKRLKNYPDPMEMFDIYGSDAVRFAMVKSSVMKGREVRIDSDGNFIRETVRLVINAYYNAFMFLKTYLSASGMDNMGMQTYPRLYSLEPKQHIMDQYIFGELREFIATIDEGLANYNTIKACEAVEDFLEVMNNWYIRTNKNRFMPVVKTDEILLTETWRTRIKDNETIVITDQNLEAYQTLYTVLLEFTKAVAPLLPCIAEKIYLELIRFNPATGKYNPTTD